MHHHPAQLPPGGGAGGSLVAAEMVVPSGDEPSFGKLPDLEMLVCLHGRERTAAEFEALYAAAGLRLTRILPTRSPFGVIEGVAM